MTGGVLWIFAFVLGAIIGSFLNVCIHRLPRGLKVSQPRRSFCPSCEKQIPWFENLPIVSWLVLRGKCSQCGAPIAFRYFLVEVLTASLFLACAICFSPPLAAIYCLFAALLVVATFIDFEHLIIPDEITIGGTIAGLILSTIFPRLMGASSFLSGLGLSFLGALSGFLALWLIVEGGKFAFGKKRHRFEQPEAFDIHFSENAASLKMGEEEVVWEDIFSRPSDELLLECTDYEILLISGETRRETGAARIYHDHLLIGEERVVLSEVREIHGSASSLIMPREAMGFGDVKFIAAIGAFLGWQAVFFTIFSAAFAGALVGVATLLATRGRHGGRIPFGPYLAFGALAWLFTGPALLDWYLRSVFFVHG